MPLRFSAPALSFNTPCRIIRRVLLLLVVFALLASTLIAQGDQEAVAQKLYDEGVQLVNEGSKESFQQAIQKFEQAHPLFHSVNNTKREAATLYNLGGIYKALGSKQKALDYYLQALPIIHAGKYGKGEAEIGTLENISETYADLGEMQNALDFYLQLLPLVHASGDHKKEADTLHSIGEIYADLGKKEKALDYYLKTLPLAHAIGDQGYEAMMLNDVGFAYANLDNAKKALDYYFHALPLWRVAKNKGGEAVVLNNIGTEYSQLGDQQKALNYFTAALPLWRTVGDRIDEASTLNNIGQIYENLGEKKKALVYYQQYLQVLPANPDYRNPLGKALELAVTANIDSLEGNLRSARTHIEKALDIIESLRTKIINQELRTSYFAIWHVYYESYVDILMRLHKQYPNDGYDAIALQKSERARARALLEMLAEANADIRQGVDPKLVERERSLQQRLNVKAQEQMKLLPRPHTEEQAKSLAQEIEALTTEFQQVEAQIRQTSPRYAALTQPQPLTLKEIQAQVLDADTLLLEYSLGKDRSYLWAVTPTSITSYELPKRDEIEASARRVYELLNARNGRIKGETKAQRAVRVAQADRDILTAAASLSQIILAPVATQLGKKRLVIVADGMLQYIPFAVLPIPSVNTTATAPQPLIVEHEVVNLPSASTLSVLRREVTGRKPATKTVVALADPVFMKNDERVKNALNQSNSDAKAAPQTTAAPTPVGTETVRELELIEAAEDTGVSSGGLYIPRLPGSRKEVEDIVAMVPAAERRLALDFEASREMATSAELSQYRYVHFSTHGFLNSVHPELSGIVFSLVNERGEQQDGFLRAHEVFNLKLPAELVVLSACQTGIGKEVKGEGLVSLTRGFMYAGAPRVVVSLWSVSETGTAELMVRFYREMLMEGKRPAAALRAAQISLMKEKQWRAPFYWAAFTLQGEWR